MTKLDWFHQASNTLIAVLAVLAAFDWTSLIPQPMALKIVGVLGLAKLVLGAVVASLPPKPTP